MRLARLVTVVWFSSVGLSMEHGIYLRMCPPCDRVEPETWPVSLSMACVVGVPCVCSFDRYIIYACSHNTQEPSLLSARRSAGARDTREKRARGAGVQTGIDEGR